MNSVSTPISNHEKKKPEDETISNSIAGDKEALNNFQDVAQNVSPFFDGISPIERKCKKKILRKMMADLEDDSQDQSSYTASGDGTQNKRYCEVDDHVSWVKNSSIADIDDILHDRATTVNDGSSTTTLQLDDIFHSDSSTGANNSFINDIDTNCVEEKIYEIRKSIHTYFNKIKKLDISVEWVLPETLKAEKGIYKSSNGLKGPLQPEEVLFIKKRLKEFCKEHCVDYEGLRLCFSDKIIKFNLPNEIRLKFIQYLCKDFITDRNPLTIHRSISKLGLRKGKFKEEEVNFLIEMYQSYTGSHFHSVCGLLLNRHRSHIFRKIERLKKMHQLGSRPSRNNINHEPSKLQRLILENILMKKNYNISSLKCSLYQNAWRSMGREYNLSAAYVKAMYMSEIIPQVFASHPVKFNNFFPELFCSIYRSSWKTWEDVKWQSLSNKLYNTGPFFIYATLRKIIMNYVPKEKWTSFRECANYLYHEVLPIFEDRSEETKEITLNKILIKVDCK